MWCPKCKQLMKEKHFSVGRAVAGAAIGAVMLGPVGLMGGLFGCGKRYVCPSCGYQQNSSETVKMHSALGKTMGKETVRQVKAAYNAAKEFDKK
ncbi:MAG: hypothetical protein PUG85_05460 [Oscillospiraceae bacterium]|nr:hypothetical protein [Oscillospiraceae bacterium]MDY2509887.1 hypothetical protein [Ruminococcus callidus]